MTEDSRRGEIIGWMPICLFINQDGDDNDDNNDNINNYIKKRI